MKGTRDHWGSRIGFTLAAAGSAIGLGNIWKFPYIAGINGGGAFVLAYLICIALVGLPILIAELYIGQQGQANTVQSFVNLDHKKTKWRLPGWLGLISAFLILSFYSVIGGWILEFEWQAITGKMVSAPDSTKTALNDLFSNPWKQLLWHFVFIFLCTGIALGGVRKGLEKWNKILMPMLLAILAMLLIYSFSLPGFDRAISFLFSMDTSKLTSAGLLEAIGHSFFTLSLGMGAILTYGSYLQKNESLPKIALLVALMDTLIALVAGVIIFTVVFTHNTEPGAGPGLIFSTLPIIFSKMTAGYAISVSFFLLIAFAALTSAVSLLEVIVSYLEETHRVSRKKSTLLSSSAVFFLGLLTVFSTNFMSEVKIFGRTFFDLFDLLTSSYFLPIGGLLISLFFGWILGPSAVLKVFNTNQKNLSFHILLWSTRIVAPLAIIIIILNKIIG